MIASNASWFKKADLTGWKIIFYILFWGMHIGLFAVGW